MSDIFQIKPFQDIPLTDPFFDSLKRDYQEFSDWFRSKFSERAYIQYTDRQITGFMYLKTEDGEVTDVIPRLPPAKRIKIGTLKVQAHGTKLGERLLKKAIDNAIVSRAQEIYITIFPRHETLIALLKEFGFTQNGNKTTSNGTEIVLIKSFDPSNIVGDLRKDYPLINTHNINYYLLSINPKWHSQLFPDSILKTEAYDLLSDISHTNSISKMYVSAMEGIRLLKPKDLLVIYRTKDDLGTAEYRSVATSICSVEEIRNKQSFPYISAYIKYTEKFSVFNKEELADWWKNKELYVIKMLYNIALTKRVIRKTLAEDMGLDRTAYWGFLKLSEEQFIKITNIGGVDGRLIIH